MQSPQPRGLGESDCCCRRGIGPQWTYHRRPLGGGMAGRSRRPGRGVGPHVARTALPWALPCGGPVADFSRRQWLWECFCGGREHPPTPGSQCAGSGRRGLGPVESPGEGLLLRSWGLPWARPSGALSPHCLGQGPVPAAHAGVWAPREEAGVACGVSASRLSLGEQLAGERSAQGLALFHTPAPREASL